MNSARAFVVVCCPRFVSQSVRSFPFPLLSYCSRDHTSCFIYYYLRNGTACTLYVPFAIWSSVYWAEFKESGANEEHVVLAFFCHATRDVDSRGKKRWKTLLLPLSRDPAVNSVGQSERAATTTTDDCMSCVSLTHAFSVDVAAAAAVVFRGNNNAITWTPPLPARAVLRPRFWVLLVCLPKNKITLPSTWSGCE